MMEPIPAEHRVLLPGNQAGWSFRCATCKAVFPDSQKSSHHQSSKCKWVSSTVIYARLRLMKDPTSSAYSGNYLSQQATSSALRRKSDRIPFKQLSTKCKSSITVLIHNQCGVEDVVSPAQSRWWEWAQKHSQLHNRKLRTLVHPDKHRSNKAEFVKIAQSIAQALDLVMADDTDEDDEKQLVQTESAAWLEYVSFM